MQVGGKELLATLLTVVVVTSALSVGVSGVGAQSVGSDTPVPADEVYVQDDGDVVVVYDGGTVTSSGSLEYGFDVGSDLAYLFVTEPLDRPSETTGELTAVLEQSQLRVDGSLSTPLPDGLQSLTLSLSGEATDQNAQLDGSLDTRFDLPAQTTRRFLQSVSVSGDVQTTSSRLTSSGQITAQVDSGLSQLPSQRVEYTLTESGDSYTLDAAEDRSVSAPTRWNTRARAKATLESQYGASSSSRITVTVDSHSFDRQTAKVDIEYTVQFQGIEQAATSAIVGQVASSPGVDLSQSEADRIASDLRQLQINELSINAELTGQQVSADYRIDVGDYDTATLAILDLAEAANAAGTPDAGIQRLRTQLEAQQATNLERTFDLSAQYQVQSSQTGSLSADVSYRTTNWAAYVQELESRGIQMPETTFDLSGSSSNGELNLDGSATVSSEAITSPNSLIDPSDPSLDPQTRELLSAIEEANPQQLRLAFYLNRTETSLRGAMKFEDVSELRDALSATGSASSVTNAVTTVENGQLKTYVTVEGAVSAGASESEVRGLAYVDGNSQVNLPQQHSRDFPDADEQRANDVLGIDDGSDDGGDDPSSALPTDDPSFQEVLGVIDAFNNGEQYNGVEVTFQDTLTVVAAFNS